MGTLALVEDSTDTLVMGPPHEMQKFSARLMSLGFVKDKDGVADLWIYRIHTHKLDPRTLEMLHQHLLPYLTGGTGIRRQPAPNNTPYVKIEDIDGVTYVSGPRHVMWDVVNKRLKSQGFQWETHPLSMWWICSMDLTPLKRKNLEKLVAPYVNGGGGDTRSPQDKARDTVLERSKAGLCLSLPFELKDAAKAAGGIWGEPTLGKKVWCLPDKASYDTLKALADKHPSMAIPREIARRRAENLGLPGLPFELKDEAKSRGGLWDNNERVWYMPDANSKAEVLRLKQAEAARLSVPSPTPTRQYTPATGGPRRAGPFVPCGYPGCSPDYCDECDGRGKYSRY